ncbi:hypothetical protein [Tuberibacillus sp. Marseille-P3662]|uniref:hypothetical protein n=1 Tax=Tuberibacillus sp. Marseille-P3662 TaxID=1965358 RepID=UPI000A1CD74B|nr:hypothetical protein [Tuberibacillus sp. Marseille-P3662]
MPTLIVRVLLFISSFSPLYVILLLSNYKAILAGNYVLKEKIYFLTLLSFLVFSLLALLFILNSKLTTKRFFSEVSINNNDLISYIATYLVPLLSIDINDNSSLITNLSLFLLIMFIYVKNNMIYINPLLLLFNYKIFVTKSGECIVSNCDITFFRHNKNIKLKTKLIGTGLYLVRKQENEE